jgi:nicotinamidase-related amidase
MGEIEMMKRLAGVAFATLLIAAAGSTAIPLALAETVIDEWASVKLPPAPALKPVTLVGSETAVLAMDFTTQTCTPQRRPRCANQVPQVAKLLAEARQKGAFIVYSVAIPGSTAADILKEVAPASGEPVLPPLGPDKFVNSDLDKMLKEHGIKTVIAIGTQAHTSVLHTGASAALRGYKVIVPLDGMSGDDAWPEAYTAWHLANAARIAPQVTLTRMDMIKF